MRKAALVWEAGTTQTTTRATTIGGVGGDLAVAGTTAQSTHQTKLAERIGPPVKPGWPDELVAPILLAIGLVATANYAPIWKAEVATWRERAWVCGVCGKLFLVAL